MELLVLRNHKKEKMKTFIWNNEYDVYIAMAPSIKEAKDLIIVKDTSFEGMMIDKFELVSVLNRDPDIILEENVAIIYAHANE